MRTGHGMAGQGKGVKGRGECCVHAHLGLCSEWEELPNSTPQDIQSSREQHLFVQAVCLSAEIITLLCDFLEVTFVHERCP